MKTIGDVDPEQRDEHAQKIKRALHELGIDHYFIVAVDNLQIVGDQGNKLGIGNVMTHLYTAEKGTKYARAIQQQLMSHVAEQTALIIAKMKLMEALGIDF